MADSKTMVKKVNIHAPIPIRTIYPNIYGDKNGLMMSPANILKCLIHRAIVHEVLPDGTLVKLDQKNYNKDNSKVAPAPKMASEVMKPAVQPDEVPDSATKIVKEPVAPVVEPVEHIVVEEPVHTDDNSEPVSNVDEVIPEPEIPPIDNADIVVEVETTTPIEETESVVETSTNFEEPEVVEDNKIETVDTVEVTSEESETPAISEEEKHQNKSGDNNKYRKHNKH